MAKLWGTMAVIGTYTMLALVLFFMGFATCWLMHH